jgi:hypothetical protein
MFVDMHLKMLIQFRISLNKILKLGWIGMDGSSSNSNVVNMLEMSVRLRA